MELREDSGRAGVVGSCEADARSGLSLPALCSGVGSSVNPSSMLQRTHSAPPVRSPPLTNRTSAGVCQSLALFTPSPTPYRDTSVVEGEGGGCVHEPTDVPALQDMVHPHILNAQHTSLTPVCGVCACEAVLTTKP